MKGGTAATDGAGEDFVLDERLRIVCRTALEALLIVDDTRRYVEFRAHWGFAPGHHLFALREVGAPISLSEGQALPRLTAREAEVLELAADGRSTRDIAAVLVLSPGTVKTHLQNIYAKLGARDRVSAVATAMRLGLIS